MTVIPLPYHRRVPQPPEDALEAARELMAEWDALSSREQNYQSRTYADLMRGALGALASSCTPLREEAAAQMADIFRRAEYGDGPARALAQNRHLKAVK